MIELKNEFKEAFLDGGSKKKLTITFKETKPDGKDSEGKEKYIDYIIGHSRIESKSLSITQSIQSGNKLDFMGCISTTAEFTIARSPYKLKDKEVQIKLEIENVEGELILFSGKVDKVTRDSDNSLTENISCYDKMNELLDEKDVTDWYAGLGDFTMTVKEFRDALFDYLKIEQVSKSLPRDNMQIKKTLDTDEETDEDGTTVRKSKITAATLIQAICQINGAFGIISNDGKMNYVLLDTEKDPFIYEDKYLMKTKHEDNELKQITSVVLYDGSSEEYSETGEALAYYPEDKKLVDGDDAVPYEITDNFILYAVNQSDALAIAQDLYNKISKVSYVPCKITTLGMPWIECGDTIGFYTVGDTTLYPEEDLYPETELYPSGYELINTVVMTRTLSGTSMFKDVIEAQGEDINSSITTINEVISAERFYRKIGDEKLYSEIEQTKEEIRFAVYDSDNSVMSQITQQANRIEMVVERQEKDYSANTTRFIMTEKELEMHSKSIEMQSEQLKVVVQDTAEINANILEFKGEIANFDGMKVNITDLANGRTTIDGGCITTGSLNCNTIKFGKVNIDGTTYDVDWNSLRVPKCYSSLALKKITYEDLISPYIKETTIPTLKQVSSLIDPSTTEWKITGTTTVYTLDLEKMQEVLYGKHLFVPFGESPVPPGQYDIPDGFYMTANTNESWESYKALSTKHTEEANGYS